jgi:hypothetical protein
MDGNNRVISGQQGNRKNTNNLKHSNTIVKKTASIHDITG